MRSLLVPREGWIHRADLIARGWSARAMRESARLHGIPLLRRQWYVLPEAEEEFHVAARTGGQLSCTSLLARSGVWRPPGDTGIHIYLRPHSSSAERGPRTRTHRREAPRPFETRSRYTLRAGPLHALAHVVDCFPYDQAFAVWESAIRTGTATIDDVRRAEWAQPSARALARDVGELSDSGLESLFVIRMRRHGIKIRQQVKILGHRVDILIGGRLVVQLDGFSFHGGPRERRRDIQHDRALVQAGFTVLRFDYRDIVHTWNRTETEVLTAIARGLHLTR